MSSHAKIKEDTNIVKHDHSRQNAEHLTCPQNKNNLRVQPVRSNNDELYQAALYQEAVRLVSENHSVIPVWGDYGQDKRPKMAAINWKKYQSHRASTDDCQFWLFDRRFKGLAVVCGEISNVAVLDFDDPTIFDTYCCMFPQLLHTRTVETPSGGKHLYYRLTDYTSDLIPGEIELRGNGHYVVTAPTQIGECEYRVIDECEPLSLTAKQLADVRAFIGRNRPSNTPIDERAENVSKHPGKNNWDLINNYKNRLTTSRNEALYRTARHARREGYTQQNIQRMLLTNFIDTPPLGPHSPETPAQRRAEGMSTIANAYEAPLKALSLYKGLPNAVREALLQQGQAGPARFMDALLLAGVRYGQEWTVTEAVEMVAPFGIGRRLVTTAVKWLRENYVQNLQANNTAPKGSTHHVCKDENSAQNPKGGRPAERYILPDFVAICQKHGANPLGDMLEPAALKSAKAYRTALNKALLERRPGQYSKNILAKRLSVTTRTINNYTGEDTSIRKTPQFDRIPISYSTLNRIPDEDNRHLGEWLESDEIDINGEPRCYKAFRWRARQLLKEGKHVMLVRQLPNHYAVIAPAALEPQVIPASVVWSNYRAMNDKEYSFNPFSPDYDRSKLIYRTMSDEAEVS